MSKTLILKNSGERERFDAEKLRLSLSAAGAEPDLAAHIVSLIEQKLYEGMPTGRIYEYAFDALRRLSVGAASRYKLKKAIMEMGPSGYPFERFIGILMQHEGYTVQVGLVEPGRCVRHEIDVLAEREGERRMYECKYHNQQGTKSDVKIPLYVQSRFLDLAERWRALPECAEKKLYGGIVTNTRFTEDAEQYALCAGLELVAWDYPSGRGIKDRIERSGLFPVTCLTTLSNREKQWLLERNTVLARDVLADKNKLIKDLRISYKRLAKMQQELNALCGS